MHSKSIQLFGILAVAAAALQAQSGTGPVYWSNTTPDCSSLPQLFNQPVTIKNASGETLGYSCQVSGTFPWLAAGGTWHTYVRLAAPASAPIGVDYTFFNQDGVTLSLDNTVNGGAVASGIDAAFALGPNQPSEVELLGAPGESPDYPTTETGTVYVKIDCPDAATCTHVTPQLLYSALPTYSWSLSVPIAWDNVVQTQESFVGIDNNGTDRVSFVVYNQNYNAATFNIYVYDTAGTLVATGVTPTIAAFNSVTGEGGTYAALLSDAFSEPLPAGPFKVLVAGGANYFTLEALQITGPSATSLQISTDAAPTLGTAGAITLRHGRSRMAGAPHPYPAPGAAQR